MDEEKILAEMLTRQRQKKKSEIHALWPMIRKGLNNNVPIRDIYEILKNRELLSCSYGYFSQTLSRIEGSLVQQTHTKAVRKNSERDNLFARLVEQTKKNSTDQEEPTETRTGTQLLPEKPPMSQKKGTKTPKEKKHKEQGPLPGTGKGFTLDYDRDNLI